MKVTVRFNELVRARLIMWRKGLAANQDDAYLFATTYIRELQERLASAGGLPSGAIPDNSTDPPSFWCNSRTAPGSAAPSSPKYGGSGGFAVASLK